MLIKDSPHDGCRLTVAIALMIATLVIYLFMIGVQLNRTADHLDDCLRSLRTVADQGNVIRPGVQRLNKTGGELLDALPLLLEDVEGVTAKLVPSANTPEITTVASPAIASTAPVTSAPAKGAG